MTVGAFTPPPNVGNPSPDGGDEGKVIGMSGSPRGADPVFTPKDGSLPARIGERMRRQHPIVVGIAVWVVAFVVLGGVMVGMGLLLSHILSPAGGGRLDVTIALNLFFQFSTSFGSTYGPLADVIALAFWAVLSAFAVLMGAALAAQLEAVRAGVATPDSARKVVESDPRSGRLDRGRPTAERVP